MYLAAGQSVVSVYDRIAPTFFQLFLSFALWCVIAISIDKFARVDTTFRFTRRAKTVKHQWALKGKKMEMKTQKNGDEDTKQTLQTEERSLF